ncbi:unnamed protein product [Gadus morhua 'NCC']
MATCERDPAAGGPGGCPGSPDSQPAVPLRPGRAGDPGPGTGEAPERSLLAVPPRAPRTPSYASEWDEIEKIMNLIGAGIDTSSSEQNRAAEAAFVWDPICDLTDSDFLRLNFLSLLAKVAVVTQTGLDLFPEQTEL